MAKKATTGHRLTAAQKKAIGEAGPETSSTSLAEKFGTSLQTVSRWRTTKPKRGRASGTTQAAKTFTDGRSSRLASAGVVVSTEGDYIVVKIPKRGLIKNVLGDLLD